MQTRTAGFNLSIGEMNPETWLVSDVLMFIGGGPAGTAGGIKVTTFLVLFFIMFTELRGEGAVNIFGKRLSRAVHRQAITMVLISVAAVVVGAGRSCCSPVEIDRVLFDVISAFGTVGLSTGITADCRSRRKRSWSPDVPRQDGPLTLGTAIALRQRRICTNSPRKGPSLARVAIFGASDRAVSPRQIGGRDRSRPVRHVSRPRVMAAGTEVLGIDR